MKRRIIEKRVKEIEAEKKDLLEREKEIRSFIYGKRVKAESCNSELMKSLEELNGIEKRKLELECALEELAEEPIEENGSEEVDINNCVRVITGDGREEEYLIVCSSALTEPESGIISKEAPIAKALIGKRVEDIAELTTPDGERRELKIIGIE